MQYFTIKLYTVEFLWRGHLDKRPTPLERPFDYVNLNINVVISTPDESPPPSSARGVASQEGFHCTQCVNMNNDIFLSKKSML